MKLQLFEVAVLLHPTSKKAEDGDSTIIVVQPTSVLAKDEDGAKFKAARLIPEEYSDKADRLEVAVRPF